MIREDQRLAGEARQLRRPDMRIAEHMDPGHVEVHVAVAEIVDENVEEVRPGYGLPGWATGQRQRKKKYDRDSVPVHVVHSTTARPADCSHTVISVGPRLAQTP